MKKTGRGAALLLGALMVAASFFYSVPAKAETDDVGNYALNAEVDASEYYKDDTYDLNPNNAVDGNLETRWASKNECASAWFSIKLESAQSVNNLIVKESAVNKQNIAEIVLEYKTEESQDWMAVSNVETERSGNVMSLFFESVTAQYFKITFYSIDPQPGLNIDEIEIRNQVRPESSVEADVEMEGFPAANLQDKNLETLWKADSASAQVTLNFTPEMTVNTITIHEDQSEGRIASIKVEIWNGSDWQMAAETECSRLPSKKNIFFNTSTVSRLRLTLVNEGESPMAVKEITVKESSEEEMPVDTELITLQPDIKPNEYQQQMVNNGYTMFVHFGLNTFTETEWTYGDVSPSVYAPPEIDADQWVKTVKEAGMKTILLVTKHHDGFCLWDSEYTDYDVANEESGNHQDVVKAVSDACNKYGINLGIYYSAWDNNWDLNHGKQNDAEYNEYMRNQITELLGGDYGLNGQITELWIDGNWEKEADRWEFDRLYDTVKKLQPQCQIGINLTIGSGINGGAIRVQDQQEGDNIGYFPSDFRIYDGQETASGADADPKLFSYRGQTYYLPFEATLILNKSWFWHTGYGSVPSREPASIADNYNKYKSQGNILVLNCGPNREGKIEQADIDSLYAAARMLGIASGDALKRPYTEILEEYRGKNLALNATGYSNETYTGDGAENHGPDEMFDGDNSTRWATRGGDKLSSVDITLDGEKEFNYLCIQEGTGFFRTDSILLEYQDAEGEWKKLAENVPFNENGRLELRFNENVKAKNLRLSLSDAEEEGPTIAEFQLYMIDSMPELEYIAEKTDLIPGEGVSLDIVDSEEQVSFKAVCEFISENEAVASVDPDGNITAIAEGDTKIIARAVIFGETMEVTIPVHVQHVQHIFDQEVVAPEYLVREATCTGAALYYKSCVCGEMGTETFEDPQGALGHSFGAEWKHDSSGHWKECICGEKKGLEAHISDGGKVTKAATANNEGIKTYTCTVCGKELKTEKIPRISSVIQPSEPSNPSNTETNAALTGDSSDLVLWGILALIAGCATVAGVYLNQKKKRSK